MGASDTMLLALAKESAQLEAQATLIDATSEISHPLPDANRCQCTRKTELRVYKAPVSCYRTEMRKVLPQASPGGHTWSVTSTLPTAKGTAPEENGTKADGPAEREGAGKCLEHEETYAPRAT
eukprot:1786614-Pyramimonas_sp.AAC.1